MFCRHHGIAMPSAGVRSTSFFTAAAPQMIEGGMSMPDVTFRRRLDGGYTIGISGRGMLEFSPQGMIYVKQFWRTFKKRHRLVTIRAGHSFFAGPEAIRAGAMTRSRPSSGCAPSIRQHRRNWSASP